MIRFQLGSLVYWGGILWVKSTWLQLHPTTLSSYTMHRRPRAIGRMSTPPPPSYADRAELVCPYLITLFDHGPMRIYVIQLAQLLRRCGSNLKVLVISTSSLCARQSDIGAIGVDSLLYTMTRKLIQCALQVSPALEILFAECLIHSDELVELMQAVCPKPSHIKRLILLGLRKRQWHHRTISTEEFTRLLATLPSLEHLNLGDIGDVSPIYDSRPRVKSVPITACVSFTS